MTITPTTLTRAAGVAAAAAGLLFIAVQINHPPMDVSSVTTTEWVVRQTAKTVMAAAALAGITGMYLRQVRQTGILGLVGYLVLGAGYLIMMGVEFAGGYVLPALAHTAPGYVNARAAAVVRPSVCGPDRRCPDRPGHLSLARPADDRHCQHRRPGPRPRRRRSPMTSLQRAGRLSSQRSWPVPAALVALSAIPLIAGTLRLVQLAGGPQLMPADQRFAAFPLPLVLHITGATAYAVVGAFQFVPRFRTQGGHPGRTGGPWLCRTLVRSLFHAVVVPSGFSTRIQPHW